ncbi:MAG: trypsin-like peptidase domain-containing protein [Candidatus Bipolaricaulia bacterium]
MTKKKDILAKLSIISLTIVMAAFLLSPLGAYDVKAQNKIPSVADQVGPAVARVEVKKSVRPDVPSVFDDPFFRYFFGEPEQRERQVNALGSGFVISWQGKKYVITNQHVVSNADEIRLVFPEDKTFKAEVLGSDEMMDVAVLEITKGLYGASISELPTLDLGDSSRTPVGAWVVAVGNPKGFQNTVTAGVLSAKNRTIPKPNGDGSYINMLQTDASINPGNSGGPLVNTDGEVIGINTVIIRRSRQGVPLTGLNFAVSINSVKQILPGLIKSGDTDRAWLGVYIQNLTAEMSAKFNISPNKGVLVAEVVDGSPADKAGIKSGDVITKVGGEVVSNPSELQEEIMYRKVGSTVEITVKRGEQVKSFSPTLVKRKDGGEKSPSGNNRYKSERYGLTFRENSTRLREQLDLPTDKGLVVVSVAPDGRAAGKLREGDVILSVERQPVNSIEAWKEITKSVEPSQPLLLRVARRGRMTFVII